MATTQSYTPDAHRLAASLPAIYASHPAAQGLAAARRITVTAAELQAAGWGNPTDPAVINTAALLLLAGLPDAADRPGVSAAIAEAWLRGAGAPGEFVAAVSDAIAGAWRELQTVAVAADQAGSAVLGNNGLLLGHAALLDLVALERHRDYLREVPPTGSERYLSAYRQGCLIPALLLGPRLSMPAAMAMYASRMPSLAEFLDEQDAALVPTDWRRLAQVGDVQKGVVRLLAGEDPALVKSEMPPPGLPYAEYRGQQRSVIAGSHDLILNLTHDRIEASRNVAAEKYLESDTIHKPAVEENLFVSARRRARQLGMSAETAEDIARLLLSNARAVQERTLNDIAQRLSRLHGQILDADSPESRTEEQDMAIPSLVVRTGDQPLARENELIKELRVTGLNESYPEQRRQFAQWFDAPHPYMETGQIVASRDADLFLQALTDGQRCKVVLGFRDLELTHAAIRDTREERRQGRSDTGHPNVRSTARQAMHDRLLTLAAAGLDLHRTDAYLQMDRLAITETAFALGSAIPLSLLNSALGLRLRDSATDTFLPLLRLADILHTQQAESGGPCRTLVLDGLGGDVYVRMARNVAEEFGFIKPSALYLRMVRSLTIYHDPRTGSAVEVMTNRVPPGSITYRDDADEVRRRIGRAYTGGRQTLEEQRRLGGNPDPRVCGVASLHAFHATTGASDFTELQRQCRAGELLCGQCKASATDRLIKYLQEHRLAGQDLPPETLQRARDLAGLDA
ncbi:Tryptophan--tRNA ligase [Geodia barretti]|uniref:Tryptophanyl-tRNA synthetase n=1 Tax=Geodia barretti TaxID=519541 RepID=A0AA35SGK3_GEOBA|nr:Tryptophan--tRNA ligase [Geodia barretti]